MSASGIYLQEAKRCRNKIFCNGKRVSGHSACVKKVTKLSPRRSYLHSTE